MTSPESQLKEQFIEKLRNMSYEYRQNICINDILHSRPATGLIKCSGAKGARPTVIPFSAMPSTLGSNISYHELPMAVADRPTL
jgi:hypothetical protein